MRVLLAEDEKRLNRIVKRALEGEGYAVDSVYDGEEARYLAEATQYDVIILDVLMPKKNGFQVCQELRQQRITTPILMLTARDDVEYRVHGLNLGADDYVVKPFNFNELFARIRSLLRRGTEVKTSKLEAGDLVLDTATREVWRGPRRIELTSKEYAILEYLMRNQNRVVTRTMLEEHAWDYEFDSAPNIIDVYIHRLRRKVDQAGETSLIQTIRRAGYRLRPAQDTQNTPEASDAINP